jgi:hypothetical protein
MKKRILLFFKRSEEVKTTHCNPFIINRISLLHLTKKSEGVLKKKNFSEEET